ncbi:MAG: hypothetical protein AAGF11_12665 [Myxococcota bacterium]
MPRQGEERFVFNGVDGATGEYLWPQMTPAQVVELVRGKGPDEAQKDAATRFEASGLEQFALREGVDPKSIAQSGWGVIFTPDEDPAVREALQPLLALRKSQAGDRYREFWGPDGYRPGERKSKFLRRHEAPTSGPVDPDRMPYYLLLVGSPDAIPIEFQAQLDLQYGVGRLHFDTVEQYDHYARSVVAAERGEVRVDRRLGLFGVRNPDDRATQLSADHLIAGLGEYVRAQCASQRLPPWSVESRVAEQATKAALAEVLGGAQTPAVLFTASHGVGFPLGNPHQVAHQGALLCQDWAGPRSGELTPQMYFAGEDLGRSARLGGLIAFLFACYGGGTPRYDAFGHRSGAPPRQIAPHSFIARLPQRMLGHPGGGALAVIAHIERAWGCSFFESRGGRQIALFESTLHRLLDGHPIGSALEYFGSRYGEVSSELLQKLEDLQYGDASISEIEIANDWTIANDARNYVVLGDPAVRVPAHHAGPSAQQGAIEVRSVDRTAPKEPDAAVAAEDPDALESFGLFSRSEGDSTSREDGAVGSLKGFVRKLGQTISNALEDVATLEVETHIVADADEVTIAEGKPQGAQLRAYTKISFDGDTVLCLPQRNGEIDQAVLELHMQMVERAQASRTQTMKTIIDAAARMVGLVK